LVLKIISESLTLSGGENSAPAGWLLKSKLSILVEIWGKSKIQKKKF
jgi:hypothetical protein